jgi:hypothetical protein
MMAVFGTIEKFIDRKGCAALVFTDLLGIKILVKTGGATNIG